MHGHIIQLESRESGRLLPIAFFFFFAKHVTVGLYSLTDDQYCIHPLLTLSEYNLPLCLSQSGLCRKNKYKKYVHMYPLSLSLSHTLTHRRPFFFLKTLEMSTVYNY